VTKGCRVVDELNLLLNISYTLESSLELREVIRPVLLKMEQVMGLQCGTMTILDGKTTVFPLPRRSDCRIICQRKNIFGIIVR